MVAVAHKLPDETKQADLVLAALRGQKNEAVRCSLLRVLGGIGSPAALEPLQAAAKDTNDPVRDAAIRALANWPNPAATPILLRIYQSARDAAHRALALRGFVRLTGLDTNAAPAAILAEYRQVMPQVKGLGETRLVLSGLANIPDPQALQLIEPCLKEDGVEEEAAQAAVKVAGAIVAGHRDLARQTVERVLSISQNDAVKQQAREVLQVLDQNEGFIGAWQVAGPYQQAGKSGMDLFNVAFAPETNDASSIKWRLVNLRLNANAPTILDLLSLLGGDQRVAYLHTWIHSDQACKARLELGSDDGVKAWLNGAVVCSNNVDRGLVPGQDQAGISLKQGWNELLLKVTQGGGGWAACARLRDPEGNKLTGVRFAAVRE